MRNSVRLSWTKNSGYNLRTISVRLIVLYQKWISPLIFPSCRFYPTCSTYARLAVEKYGLLKGGFLALIRLLKCHPYHPGGYDPLK